MGVAREFMTQQPLCLTVDTELREAMHIFLDHNITSAPVQDKNGKLLGVLTELDLVKGILRHHIELEEHATIAKHMDLLEKASCVGENDTVTVVIKAIVQSTAHRVIVVDRIQRIVGIISPKDVLKIVFGEIKTSPNLQEQLKQALAKVEELSREVEFLSRDREQYEKLFLESPYMIHSVDYEGKIIMANRKIHDVLGYAQGELLGKSIYDIYPKGLHKEAKNGLESIIDKGFHGLTYTTMLTKEGAPKRVDLASSALRSKSGEFLATITISRLVDSDALLRALHGVVKDMNKP
jgi:PAS domain S-box-containing protein